jgi:phosphoglycolate phosphatase/putative hydrolase of the HAD superfamily
MRVFSLPVEIQAKLPAEKSTLALLFDMDNTLYTNDEYAQTQIELPIERLAKLQGKTFAQMNEEIAQYRKRWAETHNGTSVSLGNTFLHFGVSIEENVRWREELCRPEDYLAEDKKLRSALLELASHFTLAVVTNNPVSVTFRTLSSLGVRDIIANIAGLDTCFLSKPNKEIFLKAADMCGVSARKCVSIGDRYDIDIALPLELGMGGILVDGVEDVYKLPELLV